MDFVTQRFMELSHRVVSSLRGLRSDVKQLVCAVSDANKANEKQQDYQRQQLEALRSEHQIHETAERNIQTRYDRQHPIEVFLAIGTWAAFVATAVAAGGAVYYAHIAKLQWNAMIETARRQFRAYVIYDEGTVNLSQDGRSYTVSIEVKNTGQTPAYSAQYWFTAKIMDEVSDPFWYFCPKLAYPDKPCSGLISFGAVPREGATDLGAGQVICMRNTFPVTAANFPNKRVYVWGYVMFLDQFQRNQLTAFIRQRPGKKYCVETGEYHELGDRSRRLQRHLHKWPVRTTLSVAA